MPGGAAGLQNLRAFLTQSSSKFLMSRRVSDNPAFLFIILVATASLLRFAGFLRFAEIGTFRVEMVTKNGDQDLAEIGS